MIKLFLQKKINFFQKTNANPTGANYAHFLLEGILENSFILYPKNHIIFHVQIIAYCCAHHGSGAI